ncbi:MAG: type II secretion system F family protein [Agathobacter sp.]|nr:type II secretion system F family protein [Agathobacter sp.]
MKKKGLIFLFLVMIAVAVVMDIRESGKETFTAVERLEPGQGDKELELMLDAGEILEDYSYFLNVEEQKLSKTQAEEYFSLAKEEIEETFCGENISNEYITFNVQMKESYQNGIVTAQWVLDNYDVVDWEGKIIEGALVSEGTLVNAQVELTCGAYSELYSFGFVVYPADKTPQEELLSKIQETFNSQMEEEGDDVIELPQEVDGIPLSWKVEKPHYALKVLFFGIVIAALLNLSKREKARKEEEQRKMQMELEYPEIVSKMLILLGSGMSISQMWNRISAQYSDKRAKNHLKESPAYEEILRTWREMEDGESERIAIEKFGKRTGIRCYNRLSQLLIQNMEKGVQGIYGQLEQEAENAFRERKQTAIKMGEEAGTKLLLPMIIMLGVVMAIIIVPAFLEF